MPAFVSERLSRKKPDFLWVAFLVCLGYLILVFVACLLSELQFLPRGQFGTIFIVLMGTLCCFASVVSIPLSLVAPLQMGSLELPLPALALLVLIPLGIAYLFTPQRPSEGE